MEGRLEMRCRRRFCRLVLLSLAAACVIGRTAAQTGPASAAGAIYKQATASVVSIEAYNDQGKVGWKGTGFIVDPSGKILTNYHVIRNSKQATVRLPNGDAYDLVLSLEVDKRKDIALLKIRALDLPSLRLGSSAEAQVGDTVYSLSNPLGLNNTLSQGIISAIRPGDGYRMFQITAPISPGSSGGPLFNTKGEVIGITAAGLAGGQELNFAIPIDYARPMMTIRYVEMPLSNVYDPLPVVGGQAQAPAGPPQVPDEARKAIETYLAKGLNLWTMEDARKVLGPPDPISHSTFHGADGKAVGDTYYFSDPTRKYQRISLTFDSGTKRLLVIWVYPTGMKWNDCRRMYGKNPSQSKTPNGSKVYWYDDRRLKVYVDLHDNVTCLAFY